MSVTSLTRDNGFTLSLEGVCDNTLSIRAVTETIEPPIEDVWAEVLAGLGGVELDRLTDLALRAQALVAEERDKELREYLENRIDQIVYERRALE